MKNKAEIGRKHISIGEAAKKLKVDISTARRYFNEGKLKGFRNPVNKYRRVYLDTVESLASEMGVEDKVYDGMKSTEMSSESHACGESVSPESSGNSRRSRKRVAVNA